MTPPLDYLGNRDTRFSSHLAPLVRAMTLTTGPVLELGMGMFSTPVMHWLCCPNRRLVSYEADERFHTKMRGFEDTFHEVVLVKNWDTVPIEQPWDVVLVDHDCDRRKVEIGRLRTHAKFVVVHDTCARDERVYHMASALAQYRYSYLIQHRRPCTTVLSNTVSNLEALFA